MYKNSQEMAHTRSFLEMIVCGIVAVFLATFMLMSPSFADDDPVDPLGGGGDSSTSAPADPGPQDNAPKPVQQTTGTHGSTGSKDADNQFRNYNPLQQYKADSTGLGAFILSGVGKLTSFAIYLVIAFFFFVTALDFGYILIPFVRPWLADANEDGQGNAMGGFGHMMGGAGGAQGMSKKAIGNRQWVSDEAITAVKGLGGSAQAQTMAGGGMGFGGGGFGMGSMGAQPMTDTNAKRTVLGDYIKSRVKVMILLGIALVMLLSSTLLGFGMDIGTWFLTVIGFLVNKLTGFDVGSMSI